MMGSASLSEKLLHSEPKDTISTENPKAAHPVLLPKQKDEDQSVLPLLFGIIWAPFGWLAMMARELDINFVFGVIVVHGLSHGLGGSIHKVATQYYWKDVQLAQPSQVQAYHGIIGIPSDIKPVWGLLTDIIPIAGYHRRPYFILSGIMGLLVYTLFLFGGKIPVALAVTLLVISATSSSIAEVIIDALAAKHCRDRPDLAADIQSLCYMGFSLGRLAGYCLSGMFVSNLGAQGALGMLLIPPALLVMIGFLLQEEQLPRYHRRDNRVGKNVVEASFKMWDTLKRSIVWMPALYMFLSWAVCPDISESLFYFYTDVFTGLSFSTELISLIYAVGSFGAFVGVVTYRNFLRRMSFRWLLFYVQIIIAVVGLLDFGIVTRLNLDLGISDPMFAIGDETLSRATDRLKYTPLFVLCAKLCPPGIEGTFFALLVSIENVGLRFASWGGSLLLSVFNVTRDQFQNLWLAILVRNALRLLPVVMIFLLPPTTPDMTFESN